MILQGRVRAGTFLGAPHPDVFQLRLITAGISGSEVQGALVPSPGRQQALKLEVSLELTPGLTVSEVRALGARGLGAKAVLWGGISGSSSALHTSHNLHLSSTTRGLHCWWVHFHALCGAFSTLI